jgi:hypothetical protein
MSHDTCIKAMPNGFIDLRLAKLSLARRPIRGALSLLMLLVLAVHMQNIQALSWERDELVSSLVAKYSVDKYCSAQVLDDCGIASSECSKRIARAKETCPEIIAAALPTQLDDAQETRLIARAVQCVTDIIKGTEPDMKSADRAGDALWEKIRPRDVDPAVARENLAMVVSVPRPAGVKRASVEFYLAVDDSGKGTRAIADPAGRPLYLENKPFMTTTDIASVDVVPDANLQYSAIVLHYSESGARRLLNITTTHRNGKMAMLVDGKLMVVLAWFMPLESASMFSNSYTRKQAMSLAEQIAP